VESVKRVSKEVIVISFFNNDDSSLESVSHFSSSNKGGFSFKSMFLEFCDLVVSVLFCLSNNKNLRLLRALYFGFDHLSLLLNILTLVCSIFWLDLRQTRLISKPSSKFLDRNLSISVGVDIFHHLV
jgi:hypothetical protein